MHASLAASCVFVDYMAERFMQICAALPLDLLWSSVLSLFLFDLKIKLLYLLYDRHRHPNLACISPIL